MDLKFIKDLQELCKMAGLIMEVRVLQDIIDDGRIDAPKVSRSPSKMKIKVCNTKMLSTDDNLGRFQVI